MSLFDGFSASIEAINYYSIFLNFKIASLDQLSKENIRHSRKILINLFKDF